MPCFGILVNDSYSQGIGLNFLSLYAQVNREGGVGSLSMDTIPDFHQNLGFIFTFKLPSSGIHILN